MSFLTSQPIDAAQLAESVHADDRGAVVTFVGTVRNHHQSREVLALSYSAYPEMAERVCARIIAEAEQRWPVGVVLAHRVGDLAIGDVAIAVVVGAAHRGEAFEACCWTVDEVKRCVPIWKRERYGDGSEAWVDPTAPGGLSAAES